MGAMSLSGRLSAIFHSKALAPGLSVKKGAFCKSPPAPEVNIGPGPTISFYILENDEKTPTKTTTFFWKTMENVCLVFREH